tara:strand:+ start:405 stop:647 length:243 start_codon:yes stop_codon:yes gene_type:complete
MFKVAQKVVCVKPDTDGDLVKGAIYTVAKVDYDGAIRVKEATVTGEWLWFNSWRFRPIDNIWVEELLCKLIEEVEADEIA